MIRLRRPLLLVALLAVSVATVVAWYLYKQEVKRYKISFETYSKQLSSLVLKDLEMHNKNIKAYNALFSSVENVNHQIFNQYSTEILRNETAIAAIQWLPIIYNSQVVNLDYDITKIDISGNFVNADTAQYYFPVQFAQSKINLDHLIGFDWGSMQNRTEALKQAQYHGLEFTFLGNIEDFGFATNSLIRAIFKSNNPDLETFPSQDLLGFVVLQLNVQQIFDDIVGARSVNDLGLVIYQLEYHEDETIYYPVYSSDNIDVDGLDIEILKQNSKIFTTDNFEWGNRKFIVLAYPSDHYHDFINYFPALSTFVFLNLLCYLIIRYLSANYKRQALIEEEVKKRTDELQRSNDELVSFANIVSHDLKEPIRGISNLASFVIKDYRDKLDNDGVEMLDNIQMLSKKSIQLATNLLEYSRVDKIDFAKSLFSVREIVDDVAESLTIFFQEHNVELIIKDKLPQVICDKIKVAEIFRNLITNGVKYNDCKHKTITIGCKQNSDGVHIFSVTDNGQGIDKKYHVKIFQIFTRLQQNHSDKEGSGLGLSLVKKLVTKHNGHIWLESELGHGTVFYFSLEELSQDYLEQIKYAGHFYS